MMESEILEAVKKFGYLNQRIDPALDLFAEIEKLKKEKKCNHTRPLLPGC